MLVVVELAQESEKKLEQRRIEISSICNITLARCLQYHLPRLYIEQTRENWDSSMQQMPKKEVLQSCPSTWQQAKMNRKETVHSSNSTLLEMSMRLYCQSRSASRLMHLLAHLQTNLQIPLFQSYRESMIWRRCRLQQLMS